jgi:TetR/AcrR family transcriptional regulator, cholesterol catabolism regulator
MVTKDSGVPGDVSIGESGAERDTDVESRRRRELVGAAVPLFIETGYHETTTRDIAMSAGWTVGELYDFVKSKSDILYLVCESLHEEVEALLRAGAVAGETIDVALPRALATYIRACDSRQDSILLIYQETTSLPHAARCLVIENEERVTDYFDVLLQQGVQEGRFQLSSEKVTRLMAHNITILGQMWAFRRWYVQKHFSLEEYIAIQTELVMRDLKPQ